MTERVFVVVCFLALSVGSFNGLCRAEEDAFVTQERQSLQRFRADVQPLIARYCVSCHGPQEQNADIRLDRLDPNMASGDDGETWHDALNELNQSDMPPKKATQPSQVEREVLVAWMTAELKRATAVRRSTGGRVVMRRLTRYEYANTMRDLLSIKDMFEEMLPPEPASPDGFKNNGLVLGMSPLQVEHYLEMARQAVENAIVTGDRPEMVRFELSSKVRQAGGVQAQFPSAGLLAFPPPPLSGPFRVQVTASAELVPDVEPPVLSVHVGYQNSPKNHHLKVLGKAELSADGPTTIELFGNMDDFPHADPKTPVSERRNPGLRLGFGNSYYSQYPAGMQLPALPETRPKPGKPTRREQFLKQMEKATRPDEQGMPRVKIESVVYEAPWYETWPPESHTQILFESPLSESDERAYARAVIKRFMRRAFRRPVETKEVDGLMAVYDEFRPQVDSLELAMREVLPEVLVSPSFLFLLEPTDRPVRQTLTDHELGSRLSYLLWSTMPDEFLSEAVDNGRLKDKEFFDQTVRRMLKDDRSWSFVSHFTDQWLKLDELNRIAINPDLYPNFDSGLKEDMRLETQHFFAEVIRRDLSVFNLLDSDFAMLNARMAQHYGIEGARSAAFERVALTDEDHRGGLLGQASILLRNSSGDDSHPILRGAWIKDRLLDDPPASPPPDVPELEKNNPAFATLPLRKQLEVHRQKESCNSCHREIDPWGVPLENFDAVGRWRTRRQFLAPASKKSKKTQPRLMQADSRIEVQSRLPDDTELDGFESLKSHLLTHEKERFARAFVRRVLTYALGRNLEIIDEETIDDLVSGFGDAGYQIDELIVAITKTDAFRTK